jgi:CIC family chloride channel protein
MESTNGVNQQPRHIPRPRFFVAIVVVAIGAALFASAFRWSLSAFMHRVLGSDDILDAFARLPLWQRVALPTAGGVLAGAVAARAKRTGAGHGMGHLMALVALGGRRMSLAATSWKALAAWSAIACGGSIGREGPLIQFGGAFGSRVAELFAISDARRRALVAAGTAAGFAAAYNTPFAAALFVIEVVSGIVALSIILPAIVSIAIATAITRALVGAGPLYGSHAFTMHSNGELVVHLILGAAGGGLGVAFLWTLRRAESSLSRVSRSSAVRGGLGGAIVGLLACVFPAVTGNGYEAIGRVLGGAWPLSILSLLLVAKLLATAGSVGSGVPGGIFTPSLFLGAALGTIIAALAARVVPIGATGGYALVGMAAVLAATTHAPLTSAVLVFEVSRDYEIVLPLMIATGVATGIARKLRPASVYVEEAERAGLRWEVTLTGRTVESMTDNEDEHWVPRDGQDRR